MARKVLIQGIQNNLPDLEELCPIFLLARSTKIPRGKSIYVSKFPPGFMLQMYFEFFDVEIIRVFTSTFVDICSAKLYPFVFTFRRKCPPLDILKILFRHVPGLGEKLCNRAWY